MNLRIEPIEIVRAPDIADKEVISSLRRSLADWSDESIEPILVLEAWISTKERALDGLIIEPSAWRVGLERFKSAPSLRFMHKDPIGVWFDLAIDDSKGLRGKAAIFGTAIGRDVALLVNAGVISHTSVSFNILEGGLEWRNGNPDRVTQAQIIEGSLVDAPSDIGSTIDGVLQKARSLGLDTTSLTHTPPRASGKGQRTMEMDVRIQKLEDDAKLRESSVDKVTVHISEVQGKVDTLERITNEIKAAVNDGTKSSGELRTLMAKVQDEFMAAKKDLDRSIQEIKTRKFVNTGGQSNLTGEHLREAVLMEPAQVKSRFTPADAEVVLNFQRLRDQVVMVDAMLETSSRNNSGAYHRTNRNERLRSLKAFTQFSEFARAMDTATTNEGLEFVDAQISGNLIEKVRLNTTVAPLFQEIPMPTADFTIDVEGADTDAELVGQTTAVISGFDSYEQTPGSAKLTLSAKKLRGRYQISQELTEDAAIAIMPYAERKIVRSISRSLDNAIINGDITTSSTGHFDTGRSLTARSALKAWDGLRYDAKNRVTAKNVDGGTFSGSTLTKIRGGLGGPYGVPGGSLCYVFSPAGYLYRLLNKDECPEFATMEKLGQMATVLTGQVGQAYGVPVLVSEFVPDNLNASGIYDNVVTDRTVALIVHREMYLRGLRRGMEVLSERDIVNDVWQLVSFWRGSFKPVVTASASEPFVNQAFNVSAAA